MNHNYDTFGGILAGDAAWMVGNTFLAWVAMLLVWQLRGPGRRADVALWVLVGFGALAAMARSTIREGHAVLPSVLEVALVVVLGLTWARAARRGARWAQVVGVVGAVAFAPNAPYVLTDCMHYVQDLRAVRIEPARTTIIAAMYGVFLVVACAAWVAIIDAARSIRHVSSWSLARRAGSYVVACVVVAFGMYLGRVPRFHSWHPLLMPRRFARVVLESLTSPGPLAFTLLWAVAIAVVGAAGLWLLDRTRRVGTPVTSLLGPLAATVTGGLLAAAPLLPRLDARVGVSTLASGRVEGMFTLLLGLAVGAAGTRLVLRGLGDRAGLRPVLTVAVAVAVPVLGAVLLAASTLQWWAQYRGLCEYAPGASRVHGEHC